MTQEEALDILKMGHNVFLTGPAGSGKTYVLNSYIKYLKKHKVPVAVTASTGIAAAHMDGTTIHSWTGIGLKDSLTRKQLTELSKNKELVARIEGARVLIIDEISMLDSKRFEAIQMVCQSIRKSARPFGGIQLVLCGDFFQLPPVAKRDAPAPQFCFTSYAWREANIVTCYLEKQYRQHDTRFLDTLNAIRNNAVTPEIRATLLERQGKPIEGVVKPTKLYTHNQRVDEVNAFELNQIEGETSIYRMKYDGGYTEIDELKKSCLAPEELVIKKGAFVMFTKNNYEAGYVNGTLGTVVAIEIDTNHPVVQKLDGTTVVAKPSDWVMEDDSGEVLATITQIPLRLAWAMTIHKSQGMSLDAAEIDLGSAFTEGMGYVALSRVRSLSGIKLLGLNTMALRVNPLVHEVDTELRILSLEREKELQKLPKREKQDLHKKFLKK